MDGRELIARMNIARAAKSGDEGELSAAHVVETVGALDAGIATIRKANAQAAGVFDRELKRIGRTPASRVADRDTQLTALVALGRRVVDLLEG